MKHHCRQLAGAETWHLISSGKKEKVHSLRQSAVFNSGKGCGFTTPPIQALVTAASMTARWLPVAARAEDHIEASTAITTTSPTNMADFLGGPGSTAIVGGCYLISAQTRPEVRNLQYLGRC